MKILLIDDHALFRAGLSHIIANSGEKQTLLEAPNAETARRQLLADEGLSEELDLILLDLGLPDCTGFDLLVELRNQYPAIPIAILSGVDNPFDVNQALRLGAAGFIPKSSTPAVMLQAIQLILSGGRYLPPEILGALSPSAAPSTTAPRSGKNEAKGGDGLTERQEEVMVELAKGLSNKEIAQKLGMSPSTVKGHMAAIFRRLNVDNRTQAVLKAKQLKFIDPS